MGQRIVHVILCILGAVVFLRVVEAVEDGAAERKPGPHPPSQALKNPVDMSEASARAGKEVFQRFCATCHGADGKGETIMRDQLPAPPSDLTDGEWKYGGTDGELFTIIRDGTSFGMDGFKDKLPEQRIWHVVNYIRALGSNSPVAAASLQDELPQSPIELTRENFAHAKSYFNRYCGKCHGEDGTGNTEYLDFLSVRPTDFTTGQFKYGSEPGRIFQIIRDGTEYDMEAFKDRLTDEQIWLCVMYVLNFSKDKS